MTTTTTTKRESKHLHIPATSALANVRRAGLEGFCAACQGSILKNHYGHRGVWRGCPADGISDDTLFVLVPVARVNPAGEVNRTTTATVKPQPSTVNERIRRTPPIPTRYTYAPADRRRVLKDAPQALRDAYKALLKVKRPVTAQRAAKLAKRPLEANRRCLNDLVEKGLAVKLPLVEESAAA